MLNKKKHLLSVFSLIFTLLVLLFSLSFTIAALINISYWPLLLMWILTLPVHILVLVFSVFLLIKVIPYSAEISRKQRLMKYLPNMSLILFVVIIILIIIFLSTNII